MAVIDRDLVRAINSGRCFALIGSGPSCELGAPSWRRLAEIAINRMDPSRQEGAIGECLALVDRNEYPKVFSLAEKALGRDKLLAAVRDALVAGIQRGHIYGLAASWPFACYLTTNFDDHLHEHLRDAGLTFVLRRNSPEDMQVLHSSSRNLIVKIHGDLGDPQSMVLTAENYQDFQGSETRRYWRDTILAVLKMVDVVLIGYSATDPDFQAQLERAKIIASPDHPLFMFAADMDHDQVNRYYQHYNIRVISYRNGDGTHRELHRLLRRYDPFIAKRGSASLGLEPADELSATIASSMYLFTQLRLADTTDSCIMKAYASVILQTLAQLPAKRWARRDSLCDSIAKVALVAKTVDPEATQKAVECLHGLGFISLSPDQLTLALAPKGREALAKIKAERSLVRDKFGEACRLFLVHEYPNLQGQVIVSITGALQNGLIQAYERRGIEIARSVFTNDVVDVSNATDILEMINKAGAFLPDDDQRMAFADLMIEVMLRPSTEMKEYLAALSQGYFAYHALGLDPRCSQERLNVAKERSWILDSSILIPILATGCLNHDYAKDLLRRMLDLGLECYTTEKLFEEVVEHAWWAETNFENRPFDAADFLQAAVAGPGYKQNLFVDGFMKWCSTQAVPSFCGYLTECLGPDYRTDLRGSVRSRIEYWGIDIVDFSQIPGFSQKSWTERDSKASEIEVLRRDIGTYRGEAQCVAEAEVVLISESRSTGFLSQSGVLNKLQRTDRSLTWRPEAMYRFLTLFSSVPAGTDLMYACMIQDFYYAGFDIVDKETVSQYLKPVVHQARMQLDEEKERYRQTLGQQRFAELREDFERVPDEQKPFYSMQFAFYVAAQEAAKREAVEARMQKMDASKQLSEKERSELNRLRQKQAERIGRARKKARRIESEKRTKRR